MPEMELSLNSVEEIWVQLLAYMGWPDDGALRQAHVAACAARGIAAIDECMGRLGPTVGASTRAFADSLRNSWHRTFTAFGGFPSIEPLLSDDEPPHRFPVAELNSTADVLIIVRAIATHHPELQGGGSINKAASLVVGSKGRYHELTNETQIERAWRKYRKVSHLAAAMRRIVDTRPERCVDFDERAGLDVELDVNELVLFMITAKDFEEFGTSFHPHGRKSPLLDQNTIWSFPERLNIPKSHIPLAAPLHENDLAVLRQYRA